MLKQVFVVKKIVIEFGGYWSFIPSLFGKLFNIPVFIVLHGTDSANVPHINYGNLRNPLLRLFCGKSYQLATMLLPVSSSLIYIQNNYAKKDIDQGIKHIFPKLKTPIHVIHNGLDTNFWNCRKNERKKEKTFISALSKSQVLRKGGDLILSLAQKHKDCYFYIAGMDKTQMPNTPDNLIFLGRLSQEKLKEYYSKCQFYLQLSVFEGFGLALCEAMLCECIPIGSSVNVIPEIIGNTGFILKEKNINLLIKLIDEALSCKTKNELGKQARERIIEKYSMDKRTQSLLSTIKKFN